MGLKTPLWFGIFFGFLLLYEAYAELSSSAVTASQFH